MKGMVRGEMLPMMALRMSWSWRIHNVCVELELVVLSVVIVAGGHGLESSIKPMRS